MAMISVTRKAKARSTEVEREKEARLKEAEVTLGILKYRAAKALDYLEARQKRNHWREAVTQMIQGAH